MQNDLFALSEVLVEKKDLKKKLESQVKATNDSIAEIENSMIDLMLQDEIQSFKKDGKTFFLSTRLFASIPEDYREDVFEWFKSDPLLSGMVKEQIHSNTLSAWVKEQEDMLPEEIKDKISVHEKTSVGVRSS